MPELEARTIKRLLSMARPLKGEIEHLLLVGSEQGLGSAALRNLHGLMEHTKTLSGDDFLDSIYPHDIDELSEEAKAQAVLLSLVQFVGYLEGILEEFEDPEPAQSDNVGDARSALLDTVRDLAKRAEHAVETAERAIGGEEGRRIAESIRDAMENAISRLAPDPPEAPPPTTPPSRDVGSEDLEDDSPR